MTRTTKKSRRTRKRKTRVGVSLFLLVLLLAAAVVPSAAQKTTAAIVVTVFRDPGFAVPRAEVVLTVVTPPPGKKAGKPRKVQTDERGEFAFQVPPGEAKYKVRASAPGLTPEEKEIVVTADERVDVYFTLKPAEK